MLVASANLAVGYEGRGDFNMDPEGCLSWREERTVAPFVFTGVQVFKPALFSEASDGPFSLRQIWDDAMDRHRLFGLRHDARWLHVGTPEAIAPAETALREG